MKTKLLAIIIAITFISCGQNEIDLSSTDKLEIDNLISDEQKSKYLNSLWHQDQALRGGKEGQVITKYGYKSKEHKNWMKQFEYSNNVIFQKMEYYLENHGYPTNPSSYDELALNSFPAIIGHNHRYNAQKRLLPYLYNAYKEGNCPIGDVVGVLGEMHESKYRGKRYEMKSNRYTTEDEFIELTDKLKINLELVKR